jgi:hypothetical protein
MPSAANELDDKDEKPAKALDEGDIALLKTYVSLNLFLMLAAVLVHLMIVRE